MEPIANLLPFLQQALQSQQQALPSDEEDETGAYDVHEEPTIEKNEPWNEETFDFTRETLNTLKKDILHVENLQQTIQEIQENRVNGIV